MSHDLDNLTREAAIDRLADEFEAAWKNGAPPDIAQYLADLSPGDHHHALIELICIDLDYRRRAGEQLSLDEYAARYREIRSPDGSLPRELLEHAARLGVLGDPPAAAPPAPHSRSLPPPNDRTPGEDRIRTADNQATTSLPELPTTASPPVPSPLPPPADAPPRRIAGYEIVAALGEGGMGVVYKARQQHPSRLVALKVVRPDRVTPRWLRQFEHEAEILGLLEHPGIARIYDAGIASTPLGPQPWFAMELIEGLPLIDFARRHNLTPRARIQLVIRICEAVQFAHQRGIIHRDLKPANILVDSQGQPRVMDFGIARATDSQLAWDSHDSSQGSSLVGTPAYMSPEQAAGEIDQHDTRTDVYSLGIIAYELLSDRRPFDFAGKSMGEILRMIRTENPPPLGTIRRSLRGDLETVISKAIAKEQPARYAGAGEFAADLERCLRHEPVRARPPSVAYQALRFARRHVVLLATGAAIVLVLIIAAVWLSILYARANQAQAAAQRRFEDLRTVAAGYMANVHDSIDHLPGATRARQMLAQSSLEFLDRLARESSGDPALQHDLAAAYLRVGDIQGNVQGANIGNRNAALESYQRAERILRRLNNDPGAVPRRLVLRTLGVCRERIGSLHAVMNDFPRAIEACRESLRLAEELHSASPEDPVARRDLASSLGSLADVLAATGDPAAALPLCRRMFDLVEKQAKTAPADLRAQAELAIAHLKLGDLLRQSIDLAKAVDHYQQARSIQTRLLSSNPNDADLQRELSICCIKMGDCLLAREQPAQAADLYDQAARLRFALAGDPSNAQARRELSIAYERQGAAALALGRRTQAEDAWHRALAIRRALAGADPADAEAQRDLDAIVKRLEDLRTVSPQTQPR